MVNDTSNRDVQVEETSNPSTSKSPKRSASVKSTSKDKKSKNVLHCKIDTLEGETLQIEVDKHSNAEILYSKVVNHLNITEKEYFGLRFTDEETKLDRWLDLQKAMKKQVSGSSPEFSFCVKFYEPEPARIQDEHTRYLLYLQIRDDIVTGRLECPESTYVLLGSYTAQAEIGDYSPAEHSPNYLSEYQFSPGEDTGLTTKVMALHREQRGQTPAQAELNFLEAAKRAPRYGISTHKAKDKNDEQVFICVSHAGIHIEKEEQTTHTFLWPQVDNVVHKKRHFKLRLQKPENREKIERNFSYKLESKRASKSLYKRCIEYHTFFRLTQADPPRKKTEFFKLKSKFRYSDRTLYELRSRSSLNNPSSPTSFTRSPSKRRTFSSPSTSSGKSPVKSMRAPIAEQPAEDLERTPSSPTPNGDNTNEAPIEVTLQGITHQEAPMVEEDVKYEEIEITDDDDSEDKHSNDPEWEVVVKKMPDGTTKRFRRRVITTTTVTTVTTSYVTEGTTNSTEEDGDVMETKPIESSQQPQAAVKKVEFVEKPKDNVKIVVKKPEVKFVEEKVDGPKADAKTFAVPKKDYERESKEKQDDKVNGDSQPTTLSLHEEVMATLDMDVVKEDPVDVAHEEAVQQQPRDVTVEEIRAAEVYHHNNPPSEEATCDDTNASPSSHKTTTTTTTVVTTRTLKNGKEEKMVTTESDEPEQTVEDAPKDVHGSSDKPRANEEDEVETIEMFVAKAMNLPPELEDDSPSQHRSSKTYDISDGPSSDPHKETSKTSYVASAIPRARTLERRKKPVPDPPNRHSASMSKHAPATLPRSGKAKPLSGSSEDLHRSQSPGSDDSNSPRRTRAEPEIKYSLKEDLLLSHEQGERGFVKGQVVQNETIVKEIDHKPEIDQTRPRSRVYTSPEQAHQAFKSSIPTRSTTFSKVQTSTVKTVSRPPSVQTKPVVIQPVSSGSAVFHVHEGSPDKSSTVPQGDLPKDNDKNQQQRVTALPSVETRTVVFDPNAPPLTTQHSKEGYTEEIIDGQVVRRRVKTVTTVTKTLRHSTSEPKKERLPSAGDSGAPDQEEDDDFSLDDWVKSNFKPVYDEISVEEKRLSRDFLAESPPVQRVPPPVASRPAPGSRHSTPEMIDLDGISSGFVMISSGPPSPSTSPTPESERPRPRPTGDVVEEELAAVAEVTVPVESAVFDNLPCEEETNDNKASSSEESLDREPKEDTERCTSSPPPSPSSPEVADALPVVVNVSNGPDGGNHIETRVITTTTTLPTEYVTQTIIVDEDDLTPEQKELLLKGQDDPAAVGGVTTTTTQIVKTTTVKKVVSGETETITVEGDSEESLQKAIDDALKKAGIDSSGQVSYTVTRSDGHHDDS